MTIVWPTTLSLDAYAAAGRSLEVPRADCPSCRAPMVFWSGYLRWVRSAQYCAKVWVPRARCRRCGQTHALLPSFALAKRLDAVEPIGELLEVVVGKAGALRPAAAGAGVPRSTARGWVRRFDERAEGLAVAFSAVAVELAGPALRPIGPPSHWALAAIRLAWRTATTAPGWLALGCWRFVSAVCGGRLLATNTTSPWYLIGRRRFLPPVP